MSRIPGLFFFVAVYNLKMGAFISAPCSKEKVADNGDVPVRPAANFCDEFFSNHQKKVLRRTWTLLQNDLGSKGVKIFLRIFQLCPDAKSLFPFRHAEGDALLQHPQFKGHGLRFMKAVGVAIDNLDTLDIVLIPSLTHLGKTHTKIPGFSVEQFTLFVEAMDYVWNKELGRQYNKEVREAWLRLFNLITSTIRDGYMQGLKTSSNGRPGLRPSITPSVQSAVSASPNRSTAKVIVINGGSGLGPVEFDDIPPIDGVDISIVTEGVRDLAVHALQPNSVSQH